MRRRDTHPTDSFANRGRRSRRGLPLVLGGRQSAILGGRMSQNLDLVRSIYADWERGDYKSTAWAHPAIEYVIADGPDAGTWSNLVDTMTAWRGWLAAWTDFRVEVEGYQELDGERVLALVRFTGRARTSGVDIDEMSSKGAGVFYIRDHKVTKLVLNWERDRVLADLGLEE
jgi:ketosteroid isomerase-like protein